VADVNARGWLTLDCPWCGKPYLGWQADSGVFFCFNCRGHPFGETLARLLGLGVAEALREASKYPSTTRQKPLGVVADAEARKAPEAILPACCGPISDPQRRYLERRGFEDVDGLAERWHIQGIGPSGGRLANRLLLAVRFGGHIVSWTARTIYRSVEPRYLSAPAACEALPIKSVVYGWEFVTTAAVVVEGPMDALKMGPGAVATFGTAWTPAQLMLLSGLQRVAIVFDSEPAAQRNAQGLARALSIMGVETEVVTEIRAKDPGEMSERDAGALRRELIGQ
jgi:hypothetical protein